MHTLYQAQVDAVMGEVDVESASDILAYLEERDACSQHAQRWLADYASQVWRHMRVTVGRQPGLRQWYLKLTDGQACLMYWFGAGMNQALEACNTVQPAAHGVTG